MLDIRWIRENPQALAAALVKRQWSSEEAASTVESLLALDEARRAHLGELQARQERRNAASREIGNAMRSKDMELAERLKEEVSQIKDFLANGEQVERENDLRDALSTIVAAKAEAAAVVDAAGAVVGSVSREAILAV